MGELDPFDFFLATELGVHLEEIEAMSHATYVRWRAYYRWKHAMEDFEMRKAEAQRKVKRGR